MEASKILGYQMELMPKFIQPNKCKNCGQCTFGCSRESKWTALNYLEEAVKLGAEVRYGISVEKIIQEKGKTKGVKALSRNGKNDFFADAVILAAGGLGTPVILQKSGIKHAGKGLFMDLLINTYGVTDGFNQINEPTMTLVDREFHENKGFILSTYISHHRMVRFIELGPKGLSLPLNRLMGIMTKTADDPIGHVDKNGKVSKPVTENDWKRLNEGSSIAKEILIKAGSHPDSILFSKVQGAHPGGTAALGKVVGIDLQTEIDNLYVCDASIFPKSPGMPPILTICALAKKLAKNLTE
jgi:choline dehydrogenase-like flavoprotein